MHKNLDISEYLYSGNGERSAHVICVDCGAQGVIMLEEMTVEPPTIEVKE